ncbi:hypothetical protein LZ31DRAFT_556296 [Colletotrichum somersetense]|nr:hypothetical protein LZ31DRAFT_556296 [Colletotrichum somersetense]
MGTRDCCRAVVCQADKLRNGHGPSSSPCGALRLAENPGSLVHLLSRGRLRGVFSSMYHRASGVSSVLVPAIGLDAPSYAANS